MRQKLHTMMTQGNAATTEVMSSGFWGMGCVCNLMLYITFSFGKNKLWKYAAEIIISDYISHI